MITFKCSCGKELKVPDTLARKVVTCNNCNRKNIQLPGPGEKLDLTDYELEDVDAGTIVLEPPSEMNSLVPRRPIKKPGQTESSSRPRRLPRREARPEPEPELEPEEEFDDEPARPTRKTRRLQDHSEESPEQAKKPSRRGSARKTFPRPKVADDNSPLKTASSQVKLEAIAKLVDELKEDDRETKDDMQAARKGRSGRGDRESGRGSDKKGKSRRSRDSASEDDFQDYGNSQKFLYVIIGAVVLLAIALFLLFRDSSPKKPATIANQPGAGTTPLPEKVAPKVEPPKYEKITEVGAEILALFSIKDEKKETAIKALEEKRKSAVDKKLSSKSYDLYIQEVLRKKLVYVLAIENILDTVTFENEEHKLILYTLESKITSFSNINEDRVQMEAFPFDLKAKKVEWDKEKLITFLDATKKDFDNDLKKVELVKTRLEWNLVVDIITNGKVEDDTFDNPLSPE